ncbi:hypothetical protein [Pseudoduganella buxea]|uniref:Uncharacterized protein n=1 Tax=Pseudoduganella buxea TaxID=1949069 RepID=A0A6I3SSQ1_9BURK|nr:hypothetical protein [Pseudoduganella buxea]MTV51675.1 hypothetical protein [Pseudoduganella buxea]GGC05111.1 hypothetical protein GCM10011572_28690 [Pseudoduganella buxea]
MTGQTYRGHRIDVVAIAAPDGHGYELTITDEATGAQRQRLLQPAGTFRSRETAHDHAFAAARAWIDGSPLHWPFAPPHT